MATARRPAILYSKGHKQGMSTGCATEEDKPASLCQSFIITLAGGERGVTRPSHEIDALFANSIIYHVFKYH